MKARFAVLPSTLLGEGADPENQLMHERCVSMWLRKGVEKGGDSALASEYY
jgi:hypothetical protein